KNTAKVAPGFKDFFVGLKKTAKRAPTALPALQTLINTDLPPVLSQLVPFTQQLTPLVESIGRYQRDVTGFLGNVTAATNAVAATESNAPGHYIRGSSPLVPEDLAVFGPTTGAQNRLSFSRTNPYNAPNSALNVANGLDTFNTLPCSGYTVGFNPSDAFYTGNPNFADRAYFENTPQEILDQIKEFAFRGQNPSAGIPAPDCKKQPPQPSIGQIADMTDYTHVYSNNP
ncbi:MAG TPA: hypothetical protein VKD72_03745, partial [Gemmataceae bacterium]|nr:hypothetical protein [Gemmataceae bacterium]